MNKNSAQQEAQAASVKPIAMIAALLAMILAISLSFIPSKKTQENSLDLVAEEVENIKQSGDTYTHILGYTFADRDLLIYRQLMQQQVQGNWDVADKLISMLEDDILLGDMLAQRYLHATYKSTYSELVRWLQNYGDMPIATRIQQLARAKMPANSKLPTISTNSKRLRGVGIRDGLGGEVMPRAWRAGLDAWMEGEFHTAETIFSTVANEQGISPWHKSAAHFWAYRASKKAGYTAKAMKHLRAAADAPFTLYGTLARHALGSHNTLNIELPTLSRSTLDIPAVKRAAAYVAIGHPELADDELRRLYARAPLAQKKQLITVAAGLDMPALQLRMSQMIYRKAHGSNSAAYPIPRWIPTYDMQVDPALIFAISRQESGFNPEARSSAGANGVMQIMPKTASYVIDRYKLNEVKLASMDLRGLSATSINSNQLNDPVVNMTVGQYYIQYLNEKTYIKGDVIRLLAAYNAGPGNLIEWNKRFDKIDDPLLFVELIPFKETRHYVKQVLSNYVVYDELINGRRDEAFALIRGNWPHIENTRRSASLANRKVASAQ